MKKNFLLNLDLGLIAPVFVLIILGLAALFSINVSFFRTQALFLAISLFAFFFFSQINFELIKKYSVGIYIFSLVSLFLVLLAGIESRGAVRWFEIFGVRLQFSEIIKPFLAISFASFLSTKSNYSFKTLLLAILFLLPIIFLIFLQPDLGNTIIYIIVWVLTLVIFGFPFIFFLLGIIFTVIAFPLLWRFLHAYQKQRILTFFHLTVDPLGSSYNAIQSIIAIGSGMLIGKGLGLGTQSSLRFLPERHTDFIFATLSEELGFIGIIVVLGAFSYLLYRIFIIFNSTDELCGKLFALISFLLILVQFFINIGMNIGLLPIVGVSLPFVSYGGSSLLSNFILLGLLSSLSKTLRKSDTLEIR